MNWRTATAIGLPAAFVARWAARRAQVRRFARRLPEKAERRIHYAQGRLDGLRYRLQGRRPDPNVPDDVLADRIRSSLGPVEKRLDVPHVHVMVQDHVAFLHGEVGNETEEAALVDAVLAVSGVAGVTSYLHLGLTPGTSRPSEGHAHGEQSDALRALLRAAEVAGAANPRRVVRATLAVLAHRLPAGERRHFVSHLPEDVRSLARTPIHAGESVHDVREFTAAVAGTGALLEDADPGPIVSAVIAAIRELVPEEVEDVAAVLPGELRDLWLTAAPTG